MRVFVSGSIHLDLISNVVEHPETLDKIGDLSIEVGGTAYNVAVNLQSFDGCQVTFHSALRDTSLSKILVDEVRRFGITPLFTFSETLPHSGFSAHLYNGDLVSAVSSIAIDTYTVPLSDEICSAVKSSDIVVADCNHNEESLRNLQVVAAEYGKPFVVCAVSEGKALRLRHLQPDAVFMNSREFKFLHDSGVLESLEKPHSNSKNAPYLCITSGESGAVVKSSGKVIASTLASKIDGPVKTFLGAGDAFCAGVIYAFYGQKQTLADALGYGAIVAARVIRSQSCNVGGDNTINRHLSELRRKATTDPLTSLQTRASGMQYLTDLAADAKISGQPLSLLFIDIDHFKRINDTCGHAVGDAALQTTAKIILSCLRDSDLAIRWGGEEIVVALPKCTETLASEVADRIRSARRSSLVPGMSWPITMSVGIARYTPNSTVDAMIDAADKAMYTAKQTGRDRVCFAET